MTKYKVTLEHRKNMSKSHWANKPDYTPDKHPSRYGSHPVSWCKGLTKDNCLSLKLAGEKLSRQNRGIPLSKRLGEEGARLMKMRVSQSCKGLKRTPEQKRNMSLAQKGRKISPEHKRKMSINAKKQFKNGMPTDTKLKLKKCWENPEYVKRMLRCNYQFHNTSCERVMKNILIELGVTFEQSYMISDIEHRYIADFYLPKFHCVVEVDGLYWHDYPYGNVLDHIRTKEMRDIGYVVLRFWENKFDKEMVYINIEDLKPVINCIKEVC